MFVKMPPTFRQWSQVQKRKGQGANQKGNPIWLTNTHTHPNSLQQMEPPLHSVGTDQTTTTTTTTTNSDEAAKTLPIDPSAPKPTAVYISAHQHEALAYAKALQQELEKREVSCVVGVPPFPEVKLPKQQKSFWSTRRPSAPTPKGIISDDDDDDDDDDGNDDDGNDVNQHQQSLLVPLPPKPQLGEPGTTDNAKAIEQCELIVIMGTEGYGSLECAEGRRTHKELHFTFDQSRAFYLIKMCDTFTSKEMNRWLADGMARFLWPLSTEQLLVHQQHHARRQQQQIARVEWWHQQQEENVKYQERLRQARMRAQAAHPLDPELDPSDKEPLVTSQPRDTSSSPHISTADQRVRDRAGSDSEDSDASAPEQQKNNTVPGPRVIPEPAPVQPDMQVQCPEGLVDDIIADLESLSLPPGSDKARAAARKRAREASKRMKEARAAQRKQRLDAALRRSKCLPQAKKIISNLLGDLPDLVLK